MKPYELNFGTVNYIVFFVPGFSGSLFHFFFVWWKMNRIYYGFLCFGLLITNSCMIVFVVMEGEELPLYQYAFAVWLAISTTFAFMIWTIVENSITHRSNWKLCYLNPFFECGQSYRFEVSGFIGLFFAMNYVFLLIANPYTPGLEQIIFNELNIVVVMIGSYFLLGKSYHRWQIVAGVLAVIGGAIPLAKSSGTGDKSHIPSAVWYMSYLFGTIPIALANIFTENIVKYETVDAEKEERLPLNGETNADGKKKKKKHVQISQLYFFANMWTLGFVLALFWVPGMAYSDKFWGSFVDGMRCLITFCSTGTIYLWISTVFSWFSTWSAARLIREDDVVVATLIMTVAPFLSSLIFGMKKIFGHFYQPIPWTAWLAFFIIFIAVVVYKIPAFLKLQPDKNERRMRLKGIQKILREGFE